MGRCNLAAAALLMLIAAAEVHGKSPPPPPPPRLLVGRTLVPHAGSLGAVCLDGSPPAYHLHRGSGSGVQNWLLQFEGGGWCNDVVSCLERSRTRRGSTRYMNHIEVFSGILSNDSGANPDFYNWNRVKLRYCDGASFAGDSEYHHNKTTLYFRGQRIWEAIILDLLPKGLLLAKKALLSGCSAGGLATFLHCDDFAQLLPETAIVKCMSDAGFFLNVRDISGNNTIEPFFNGVVTLQGVQGNLNQTCLASQSYPYQCFFPQTALTYIRTPYFILNSAYDVYQFHHIFVPPTADPHGHWNRCKFNLAECTVNQIAILQVFRVNCRRRGLVLIHQNYTTRLSQRLSVTGTLRETLPKKLIAHTHVARLVTTFFHRIRQIICHICDMERIFYSSKEKQRKYKLVL